MDEGILSPLAGCRARRRSRLRSTRGATPAHLISAEHRRELAFGFSNGKAPSSSFRRFRNPLREGQRTSSVSAGLRVLVPDFGQIFPRKTRRKLDQGRPHPAVHVGDLSVDELTHEHVARLGDRLESLEDLVTLGVPPPATTDRTADNPPDEIRHGTPRGLKHDAVPRDEGEPLLRGHPIAFAAASAERTAASMPEP